jgi:uncharacterized protein (DUF697 family)/arsenate reductase-like glutaredoxin family protein
MRQLVVLFVFSILVLTESIADTESLAGENSTDLNRKFLRTIETILHYSSESHVTRDELGVDEINCEKSVWALEKALGFQQSGDMEMRNQFLSIALVFLERARFRNKLLNQPSSPKSSKFSRLYGNKGIIKNDINESDSSPDRHDLEKWVSSLLKNLGLLDKKYARLNDKLREQYPHLSREQLADHLIRESSLLTAGVGFAVTLPGAIPGVGTMSQIAVNAGTLVPDMIFLFKKQVTLIFRIAEIYGKDLKEDERVTEALILFGIASGVSSGMRSLERYLQYGVSRYVHFHLSQEVVKKYTCSVAEVNHLVGKILCAALRKKILSAKSIQKVMTSMIPVIGATMSGSLNYLFTRKVGNLAKTLYGDVASDKLEVINSLKMPHIELAMFRYLVLAMKSDGKTDPLELLTLKRMSTLYPQDVELINRIVKGDEELMDKIKYDLSSENMKVRELVLYSVTAMEYADGNKNPDEISFHKKLIEELKIPKNVAAQVEIEVRKNKLVDTSTTVNKIKNSYHGYRNFILNKK